MPRAPVGGHLVEWFGLNEFERELAALPKDLADDAVNVLMMVGQRTATAIGLAYPVRTGHLRGGMRVTLERGGGYGPRVKVANAAPHAHLYERGTKYRYLKEVHHHRRGWRQAAAPEARVPMGGIYRGKMPATPTFVPRMQTARRELDPLIADLMRWHGLTVTGA